MCGEVRTAERSSPIWQLRQPGVAVAVLLGTLVQPRHLTMAFL